MDGWMDECIEGKRSFGTMTRTTNNQTARSFRGPVPSPCQLLMHLSMCFAVVLITVLPRNHMVAGGATESPTFVARTMFSDADKLPESVHLLDLSYLHRCGVNDIANVIRGTLEQQQQQQRTEDTSAEAEPVVDIDLTASLIGKNVSEILASMANGSDEDDASRSPTSVPVRLKARRNKLSPEEIATMLEFVLQNGPTNETIAITTSIEEKDEDITENENKTATISSEEDRESSPEKATTLVAEEPETVDNITVAAPADTSTAENVSTEPSNADGDSNDTDTIINDGGGDDVDTETESATTTTVATTRMRPAFVSIRSLDLGWNDLGSSSSRRSAGARTVNRALRQLLANPERCPPTIVLEMCGLKPRDCRDLARGIVERYQVSSEKREAEEGALRTARPPQPLSLNLACNEGIGDVGVAALAAAIRTAVLESGSGNSNKEETRKKRRRKKKKRSKKQALREDETEQMKTAVEEDEVDKIEQETKITNGNEDGEPPTEEQSGSPSAEADANTRTILERLDLSGCDIGDIGAEALAIALKDNPLCVKHLDLSNNKITDQGAIALALALGARGNGETTEEDNNPSGLVETLDLSHNKDLGDRGAKELAQAFQRDGISNLVLRSCNVRADGAACFGRALRSFGLRVSSSPSPSINRGVGRGPEKRSIDLSGNPLGILGKKKKSGSKYSATAIRSKAKDTTKVYMNIIGKSLQKGLNSISGEFGGGQQDTLESDDEEEDRMGNANEDEDDSRKKCGALSLAEAFLRDNTRDTGNAKGPDTAEASVHVELGLRFCSFDTRAAEALAAVLQESNQNYSGMKLALDVAMNDVLEESTLAALHGEDTHSHRLEDMAEVYLEALAVVREARERALQASKMAAARARARAEREMAWGSPHGGLYEGGMGALSDDDEIDDGVDDDSEDSIPDEYDRNMQEYYSDDDDQDW